ncbi:MAG: lectin OAA [Bacteroidota bacterium]
MAAYFVKTEERTSKSWNRGGMWILGSREHHNLSVVDLISQNGGKTLYGTASYAGEKAMKVKAELKHGHVYNVYFRKGGISTPWEVEGTWVIGANNSPMVTSIALNSPDKGDHLTGVVTFEDKSPMGFKASMAGAMALAV